MTDSQTPESLREQLVEMSVLVNDEDNAVYREFEMGELEALITAAALAAYYEGLIPEKFPVSSTLSNYEMQFNIGHNFAIDTMRRNFKGQPNEEESL